MTSNLIQTPAEILLTHIPNIAIKIDSDIRIAAIDCGTNSIRLLISDYCLEDDQIIAKPVLKLSWVVRLGYKVDIAKKFDENALDRTIAAIRVCAEAINKAKCQRVRFVATSATRDASNRHLLLDAVQNILQVEAEVISGEEEARLSYLGASNVKALGHSFHQPVNKLVVDLGGGSTEIVLGVENKVISSYSMNIGSVRISERCSFVPGHFINDDISVQDARRIIRAELDIAASEVNLQNIHQIIGVAGTITTVGAYLIGLNEYDSNRIHGYTCDINKAVAACQELTRLTREELQDMKIIHPGRLDIIGMGAFIFSEILLYVSEKNNQKPVISFSENNILDGIAKDLAFRYFRQY